jgi:methylthioribose-1-phosphate isomerase
MKSMSPSRTAPQIIAYLDGQLIVLDQTALPAKTRHVTLSDLDGVEQAIRGMIVRGAPLIGVTAAFGLCVAHLASLLLTLPC